MKHFLLCAGFCLTVGVALAAPARPRYEPAEPSKLPSPIVLIGWTWSGRLYTEGEEITFHADGSLTYGARAKGQGSPGTWRLTGNQLFFQINNWSEYETIVQGDIIAGKGWNKSGQKCQPYLRRVAFDKMQEKAPW